STVKGRFGEIKGTVAYDAANPATSKIDVEIATSSIDTRTEQRDTHLRSADFFDVQRFPAITFKSHRIEGDTTGKFHVVGDLTIRDVTREVSLNAEFEGKNTDPWGNTRMAYVASAKINRKDFGLHWNQALETGGWLVGDDIKIAAEVQLVLQK